MRMNTLSAGLALMMVAGVASSQDADQSDLIRAFGDHTAAQVLEKESAFVGEGPEMAEPELWPGDPAPALDVATFVKGAPISEFEEGTAYLVDFWATWCGPCIASMPHLSQLEEDFGGDNFRVVGVSIWEQQTGDELIDHVTTFVDGRDTMEYTVAIDNNGAMARSWMNASGQQGIPTALLVDREGRIAWIGYGNDPEMDTAIEAVVDGTWDIAKARESRVGAIERERQSLAFMPWYRHFAELASSGETERAGQLAAALFAEGKITEAGAMNAMAWAMVESEGWDTASLETARALAAAGVEQTGWSSPDILDTLAWAEHRLGNHAEAVRVQTKAIELLSTDEERAMYGASLDVFKKAAGQG